MGYITTTSQMEAYNLKYLHFLKKQKNNQKTKLKSMSG